MSRTFTFRFYFTHVVGVYTKYPHNASDIRDVEAENYTQAEKIFRMITASFTDVKITHWENI